MAASQSGLAAKVVPATNKNSGVQLSVIVSGGSPGAGQVDVTHGIISGIAHALYEARGGESIGNWADAERLVQQLLGPQALGGVSASADPPAIAGRPPGVSGGRARASDGDRIQTAAITRR